MTARWQGVEAFRRKLRALPQELKGEVQDALVKSANEVADTARALAPVDHGALKGSIKVTPSGGVTPPYSSGGSRTVGELEAAISAGNASIRYAAHVEFGTQDVAPRPFMKPAFRLLRKRIRARMGRVIKKVVRKVIAS